MQLELVLFSAILEVTLILKVCITVAPDKRHGTEDNDAFLASYLPRDFNSQLLINNELEAHFKDHKKTL